jgi:hypothetical protein
MPCFEAEMVDIVVSDEQARAIIAASGAVRVRDAQGRILCAIAPRSATTRKEQSPRHESAYELAQELGILGGADDLPPDLSTNPRYLEGLGRE